MNKTAFFTMDVESFSEISCLREKPRAEYDALRIEGAIGDYLDLLDKYNIKATFFVLCSSLEHTGEYLARAVKGGHEIALHGLSHDIPAKMDGEELKRQLAKGRAMLERQFATQVIGYRAPCFGVTDGVLDAVRELGFKYDSSCLDIRMSYYRAGASLKGFERVAGGVYRNGGFYELAPCKARTAFGTISVSGGGYIRLAPDSMVKRGVKNFLQSSDYYMFYCHPSDIFAGKLPKLKGISPLNAHFVKAGRKDFLTRTEYIIKTLKDNGFAFSTMRDFVLSQGSEDKPQGSEDK